MTEVRCASSVRCQFRGGGGICKASVIAIVGHDARCSVAQETLLHEHEERLRAVRERESKGVKVLDVYHLKDPDRDEDDEDERPLGAN
jgi:hypothetical protein